MDAIEACDDALTMHIWCPFALPRLNVSRLCELKQELRTIDNRWFLESSLYSGGQHQLQWDLMGHLYQRGMYVSREILLLIEE